MVEALYCNYTHSDLINTVLVHGPPRGSAGKEFAYDAGGVGSIPGFGRSPGEETGNPLQCSCLGNPMDRGTWQAAVHGVTQG